MKPPEPSKEQQILFNILKGVNPTNLEGIDTSNLFDLFRRHRLFPLAPALLPMLENEERERWKNAIRSGSMRSLNFVHRLIEILDLLHMEGIEAIPLKGPALAQALYGDVSQRHMRDLDLLVIRGDMEKAMGQLQMLGYSLKYPEKKLTASRWRAYFRYQYDVVLVQNDKGGLLELHKRIAYPGLLGGMEHLLTEQQESIEIAGRMVKCMSRETTFIYLAVHGVHHLFFRLFWLRDIAEALNRWELDHSRILYIVREMGIERMLGISLRLTGYYFGTSIPSEYRLIVDDNSIILNRLFERCKQAILDPKILTRKNRLNVLLFSMALKPDWRHKWETISSVYHRWVIRRFVAR